MVGFITALQEVAVLQSFRQLSIQTSQANVLTFGYQTRNKTHSSKVNNAIDDSICVLPVQRGTALRGALPERNAGPSRRHQQRCGRFSSFSFFFFFFNSGLCLEIPQGNLSIFVIILCLQ